MTGDIRWLLVAPLPLQMLSDVCLVVVPFASPHLFPFPLPFPSPLISASPFSFLRHEQRARASPSTIAIQVATAAAARQLDAVRHPTGQQRINEWTNQQRGREREREAGGGGGDGRRLVCSLLVSAVRWLSPGCRHGELEDAHGQLEQVRRGSSERSRALECGGVQWQRSHSDGGDAASSTSELADWSTSLVGLTSRTGGSECACALAPVRCLGVRFFI